MSVPEAGAGRLTPPGAGAVAVIEVTGPDARERLAAIGLARMPGPGEVRLVRPSADGALLDEALLLRTGGERFELHIHASPPLVDELCERLGVTAEPGLRGVEDRALRLVPEAASELGARVLLAQAGGALRREVEALRTAGAGTERALLSRATPLARLLVPARVVLVGAVNSGKSTLFNALAGEARATVSAEGGTTRDVLSARVAFGPYPIELVDTAGARELAADGGLAVDVEREGQALARWLTHHADLVLHLVPVGEPPSLPATGSSPGSSPGPTTESTPGTAPRRVLRTKDDAHSIDGGISALHDPHGGAERVARAALAALGLPPEPFPDPDVGAPFTAALEGALRAAFRSPAGPERDAGLDACLGSPPAR